MNRKTFQTIGVRKKSVRREIHVCNAHKRALRMLFLYWCTVKLFIHHKKLGLTSSPEFTPNFIETK